MVEKIVGQSMLIKTHVSIKYLHSLEDMKNICKTGLPKQESHDSNVYFN